MPIKSTANVTNLLNCLCLLAPKVDVDLAGLRIIIWGHCYSVYNHTSAVGIFFSPNLNLLVGITAEKSDFSLFLKHEFAQISLNFHSFYSWGMCFSYLPYILGYRNPQRKMTTYERHFCLLAYLHAVFGLNMLSLDYSQQQQNPYMCSSSLVPIFTELWNNDNKLTTHNHHYSNMWGDGKVMLEWNGRTGHWYHT